MSEARHLRERAEELTAIAIKARKEGQFQYAESLLAQAAQYIEEADTMEGAEMRADPVSSREQPAPAPAAPEKK